MKCLKKLFAMLLCFVLITVLGAGTAFAKSKKDDEEESDDYSVSDVYFDISDDAIYVGWTVGDGECKYTVQLYDSSDFKTKNKIGSAMTVSYNAEMADVTQKILNEGSGTYYAVVTCKKKPKGASSYASAYGRETIYSDDLSTIRQNRKEAAKEAASGSSSSGTGVSGVDGGPGVSAGGTSAGTSTGNSAGTSAEASTGNSTGTAANAAAGEAGSWQALEDGKWAYVRSDGSRATGWFEAGGKWYFSGEDGVMAASSWIPSASEEGVFYYVDETGAMMTNAVTPDGYTVDADGKWRAA